MSLPWLAVAALAGGTLCEGQLGFAPAAALGLVLWRLGTRRLDAQQGLRFGLAAVAFEALILAPFVKLGLVYAAPLLILHFAWRAPFVVFAAKGRACSPWVLAAVFAGLDGLRGEWGVAPLTFGEAFAGHPWLISVAALGGRAAVSFVVVAIAFAGADLLLTRARDRAAWAQLLMPPAVCVTVFVASPFASDAGPRRDIAIVQANLPKWSYDLARTDPAIAGPLLEAYLAPSRRLPTDVDIVVWPETAVGRAPADTPGLAAALAARPDQRWLIGAPIPGLTPGTETNAALALSGDLEASHVYRKRAMVPFYEDDFTAGTTAEPLELGGILVAPLICWESLFSPLAAHTDRADLLVVLTDDGAFADPSLSQVHLRRTILRAVERGRPAVHAGQVGPSGFVDAAGRVQSLLPAGVAGVTRATVETPGRRVLTPYARAPLAFPALALAAAAVAALRSRRRRP